MENPKRFAHILTEAIYAIKQKERKPVGLIEEELGYACGKEGSSYIIYLRKGHIPSTQADLEKLTKNLIELQGLTKEACEEFLIVGGHPNPNQVLNPPPVDRPDPVEYFTGREAELGELITNLQPRKVVTLYGPGGVGKTALVAEALHKLSPNHNRPEQFPAGIFYHNFYRQTSIDATIEQIARFFEEDLSPTPYHAAQRALFKKQALLVLDGAEEADYLEKVLDIRGQCGILLVTCDKRIIRGKAIFLDVLPLLQAITVLQAWSTHEPRQVKFPLWSQEQQIDIAIATEICELLGRLPLALRLAGSYMSQCETSATEFLELLKKTPLFALHTPQEQRQDESVAILLKKSLEKVRDETEEGPKIFAVVGCLAETPFYAEIITNALETSPPLIQLALNILVRFSLVKRLYDGRYQAIHRLAHIYAKKNLPAPNRIKLRLADYYIKLAEEQNQLCVAGSLRLDVERSHIKAVLVNCVDQAEWMIIKELLAAINPYLAARGYLSEFTSIYELGLGAIRALNDPQTESRWLLILVGVYLFHGPTEQAIEYNKQALTIAHQINNRQFVGFALSNFGLIYSRLGQKSEAINFYEQALALTRELRNRQQEAALLCSLGGLYLWSQI